MADPAVDTRCEDDGETVLSATASALLARLAHEQSSSRAPSIVSGLIRSGRLVWHAGRGRVDGVRPGADTQYRIGSLTKIFTGVLVLRLRDEHRLDLADPLDRHLPGTPFGDRTVGHLLSHTAGVRAELVDPWWERSPGPSWPEVAPRLDPSSAPLRAGNRFHYSNLGFAALGALVAELRGKSWYDVLRAEILDPLEMWRTTFSPEEPHARGFAVHPYADVLAPEPAHDGGGSAPAGQLWSTLGDMARWATFLAGDTGDVLDPATMAEMREPNAVEQNWTSGYGLGVQVYRAGNRSTVGHGGSMPGFLASIQVDVAGGTAAVSMSNVTSGPNLGGLGTELLDLLDAHEPRVAAEWLPASGLPDGLLDVVGPWYWGSKPHTVRALPDGLLHLGPTIGTGRASRFRPIDGVGSTESGRLADQWIGMDGYYAGEQLRIHYGADGRVNHLNLGTFIFAREPYDPRAPIPGGVDEPVWRPADADPGAADVDR